MDGGYMMRGKERNAYRSLRGWNPERKKPLERSKLKW